MSFYTRYDRGATAPDSRPVGRMLRGAAMLLMTMVIMMSALTQAAMNHAPTVAQEGAEQITETSDAIHIATSTLEASVARCGYVSGVAGGSLLDKKSGFRDAGFGLDIVDWLMEPGSDAAYRQQLPGDLAYEFDNLVHGQSPKRSVEGPQICTQARELAPQVTRGKDFVAVQSRYQYTLAAPGKKPGSVWEQTLVFPRGKRYFLSSDKITTVNSSDAMFLRVDMPGHIKHQRGDTFSEIYLSYAGRVPASAFFEDFAPDTKFRYRRQEGKTPRRLIRAYRLRDPKTGKRGPWLAGMTLDPSVVYEAWCHQRGYVSMIEEIGGRPIRPGGSFSAAFLVGYFDSIKEMHQVYDQYAGHNGLEVSETAWRLSKAGASDSVAGGSAAVPARSETADERVARRLEWFQDQKFGLFMHWGIYSQWGCIESWPLVEEDKWARPDDLKPWVERGRDMERFKRDYWALNRTFNPTKFNPVKWAEAAHYAGMKYFVFTTKHHDGFNMFDTRQTDYKITGPACPFSTNRRADVTRELFNAFRAKGFGIGAYYSKADWHHPDYWSPDAPARTRNPNYDPIAQPEKWGHFVQFVHHQIEELTTRYGPIDILWLDAGQVRPPQQDLQMDRLAEIARRHQPDLLIVDRTVGGKYENYRTPEQEVPEKPLPYAWESCITMGDQWSYKPDDRYKSTRHLIHLLVDVVAKGGNLLLNIGPQPDGQLPPVALSRLIEIGDWMKVNGEAIYATRPITPYKAGPIAFTHRDRTLYAIYLLPEAERLPATIHLQDFRPALGSKVYVLGQRSPVAWHDAGDGCRVDIPPAILQNPLSPNALVLKLEI